MSSEALVEGETPSGRATFAAWDTSGQVFYGRIDPSGRNVTARIPAPGEGKDRKHPALAVNSRGEVLMAWTEGSGWQKGGDLAWQVFDASGQPTAEKGRLPGGIPAWGLPATFARPEGGFTILH